VKVFRLEINIDNFIVHREIDVRKVFQFRKKENSIQRDLDKGDIKSKKGLLILRIRKQISMK
jgi:hypothetical protein